MTSTVNMTDLQAKTLCKVLRMANELDFSRGKGGYEIKQYEVSDCDYFLSVVIETGSVGDEGTLASIICRERAHLFIGKRGGITYINKRGTQKRFTRGSLLTISLDQ